MANNRLDQTRSGTKAPIKTKLFIIPARIWISSRIKKKFLFQNRALKKRYSPLLIHSSYMFLCIIWVFYTIFRPSSKTFWTPDIWDENKKIKKYRSPSSSIPNPKRMINNLFFMGPKKITRFIRRKRSFLYYQIGIVRPALDDNITDTPGWSQCVSNKQMLSVSLKRYIDIFMWPIPDKVKKWMQ